MQVRYPEHKLKVVDWDDRYSRGEHVTSEPSKLLVHVVENLEPRRALDVACAYTIEHYHETQHLDTDAGNHTHRSAEIVARKL